MTWILPEALIARVQLALFCDTICNGTFLNSHVANEVFFYVQLYRVDPAIDVARFTDLIKITSVVQTEQIAMGDDYIRRYCSNIRI